MDICLCNFEIIRPKFEIPQEITLEWLARAHAKGEASKEGWEESHPSSIAFEKRMKEWLFRLGAGPKKVQSRGTMLADFGVKSWDEMEIYRLRERPQGYSLTEKMVKFTSIVDKVFEQFYPEDKEIADHLIHVTCTGYVAPSGAQKIVSSKKSSSVVTHAYHMGCYASIPAMRMGSSFLKDSLTHSVDIVHTEVCSLHVNPVLHDVGQIIVESLFADGFIKYSVTSEKKAFKPHLKLMALHEEILPSTLGAMRWDVEDWGFKMFITKDIPLLIANNMEEFLIHLCEKAEISFEAVRDTCYYALHPGGPKILEQIADVLHLKLSQLAPSFQVLQEYGNMSSATLPHIWARLLNDPLIPDGATVISLAYGPGLTICGALLQKCGC
ncbi:MAG: 3-oxoacyl-[acyl-carrier-protein] synthase III C-terminal domain-containing protein [Chlamydiota bacterium]